MNKKFFEELDERYLSKKSQIIFEQTDIVAQMELFGNCKTIEEVDKCASALYDEYFA